MLPAKEIKRIIIAFFIKEKSRQINFIGYKGKYFFSGKKRQPRV